MTVFKHAKQVQYQKKKQTIGQISVGFSQIAKAIRQKNTSQETVGSNKLYYQVVTHSTAMNVQQTTLHALCPISRIITALPWIAFRSCSPTPSRRSVVPQDDDSLGHARAEGALFSHILALQ